MNSYGIMLLVMLMLVMMLMLILMTMMKTRCWPLVVMQIRGGRIGWAF